MDTTTIITLLTIAVILLTVVIITILVVAIALLVKVNRVVRNFDHITENIVAGTAWLSPVKLFTAIAKIFTKQR